MDNELKIKKCPFCGGEIRFVKTGCSSRGKIGHLYCDGCKETFFKNDKWYTELDLYESWNTRTPVDNVIDRLEEESNFFGGEPMGTLQKTYYCKGIERVIEIIKELM